jgi:SOS-response transcriptional repressor LexA
MSLKDRLKVSRKNAKKTQLEVAEAVKMSQPAYQALESGRNQKSSFLPLIADFLNVDPLWLTTGERVSSLENSDLYFKNVVINESPLYKIPILDFVQAGIFHESGYDGVNPKGETYTTYRSCRPESVFSLEVSGLSMSPEFLPGDKLVVDSAKDPYPGCYVIAQNGSHEATFKKYRAIGYDEHGRETFELVPLNPDFPVMNSTQHEIRIIGVVVEHLRSFCK